MKVSSFIYPIYWKLVSVSFLLPWKIEVASLWKSYIVLQRKVGWREPSWLTTCLHVRDPVLVDSSVFRVSPEHWVGRSPPTTGCGPETERNSMSEGRFLSLIGRDTGVSTTGGALGTKAAVSVSILTTIDVPWTLPGVDNEHRSRSNPSTESGMEHKEKIKERWHLKYYSKFIHIFYIIQIST